MPSKHPLLLLLGGLAALALGMVVGLLIGKGDKAPVAVGHEPKTLAKTHDAVPISPLPTQTSIPALRTTTTVEATEPTTEEPASEEEPTEDYIPSPEPYFPEKEEQKPIVSAPSSPPEATAHGTITVGPIE
jgi:hypothetical protein